MIWWGFACSPPPWLQQRPTFPAPALMLDARPAPHLCTEKCYCPKMGFCCFREWHPPARQSPTRFWHLLKWQEKGSEQRRAQKEGKTSPSPSSARGEQLFWLYIFSKTIASSSMLDAFFLLLTCSPKIFWILLCVADMNQ